MDMIVSMQRRNFLLATGGALVANAATPSTVATILYGDKSVTLDHARIEGTELWVRPADLPRINEFELKPQGACRADLCIPVSKALRKDGWFHLTGFARQTKQAFATDAAVWSFAELPVLGGEFLRSRMSPDFAVPDRQGRLIHLSDFRGKKTLVITWASW